MSHRRTHGSAVRRRSGRTGACGAGSQRGAALLLAMLIVTMVSTLAGTMLWQQWRAVQVEVAERARTQAAWILNGATDWARLILRSDDAAVDHLGEPWATPLAEARLSSFLAADRERSDETGPEAFLSGSIVDAQSRYNLNNLVSGGEIVAAELASLQRLFEQIGVSASLATTISVGLRDAGDSPAAAAPPASAASQPAPKREPHPDPPLRPQSLAQLSWFGIDPGSLRQMQPHVDLLPAATPVNINTASREVLAAVIGEGGPAAAQRLIQTRERSPFRSVAAASALLGDGVVLDERRMAVASNYFDVRGRLRLDQRVLEERSLVNRIRREVTLVARERISGLN